MSGDEFTMIIKNAYLSDLNGVYDVGIFEDRIREISKNIDVDGREEIDAKGNLVSPGLVDCHTHMDKSFASLGGRFPRYNEKSKSDVTLEERIEYGLEYFKDTTVEEIKENVVNHARGQISNGVLYTLAHVDVDSVIGTKAVEAVLEAREELSGLIDIQVVAFAQSGFLRDMESETLVRSSLDMGAEFVGGLDPASRERNVEGSLDLIFGIARDHNVDVDLHVHDPGSLGRYTLERLAQRTLNLDYQGRVTASHSFCLSDAPRKWLDESIPVFKDSGLKFVTCYPSTPFTMPVKNLIESGVPIAIGSDNVRDFWAPFGNEDMVLGAYVESRILGMNSNPDLKTIWDMITKEGAKIMNLQGYGIQTGNKADMVVFDALSPQWAIINQAEKQYVIKNGRIVARKGEMCA